MVDRPVTFSAKAEYFTASGPAGRLLAAYLKSTNQLRMETERPRAAQDTLEAALALLLEGKLFGIYPEGTRSPDGRLYRGRPGVGDCRGLAGGQRLPGPAGVGEVSLMAGRDRRLDGRRWVGGSVRSVDLSSY